MHNSVSVWYRMRAAFLSHSSIQRQCMAYFSDSRSGDRNKHIVVRFLQERSLGIG